jgi:hypothetical protein
VEFSGKQWTVIDGPFAETKELIAGYWLWQVKSKEEAIGLVKRYPNSSPGTESEIGIRQLFEAEDFGAEFTPELRDQEEHLRTQIDKKKFQRGIRWNDLLYCSPHPFPRLVWRLYSPTMID